MKYLKLQMLLACSAILIFSCKKVEQTKELGDRGQTIVKLLNPGYQLNAIDITGTPQTVCLSEIRRDIPNESELAKPLTITVMVDTAALRTYNLLNGTSFFVLPSTEFTTGTDVVATAPFTYTVTFQPGEFAKCLSVTLPHSNTLDLTKKYAFPVTLQSQSTSGERVSFDNRSAFIEISTKNKYDGKYKVTGTYVDVTSPAFTAFYPYTWDVVTIGASSNRVDDLPNLGGPGFLFSNAGAPTYYGEWGLIINFDPATDAVSSVTNSEGQPSPTRARAAVLDPTGINKFNPADHSIDISYIMTQAGSTKAKWTQHFAYIGPR